MHKYICLVFILLISIGLPLFPEINWKLLLDRQIPTNKYGFEVNGQRGIQDEELVPDPNGNKVVDDNEIDSVLEFLHQKSTTLLHIREIQTHVRTSFINSKIDFSDRIEAIKRNNISEFPDLLLEYQRLKNQDHPNQRHLDYLGHQIAALNGYQIALSDGRLYLPDGRICEGQLVGAHKDGRAWSDSQLNEVQYIWELTQDHRIDLPTGHFFFIEEGSQIDFNCIDNSLDYISQINGNTVFNGNEQRIGIISVDKYSLFDFDVVFNELPSLDIRGNTYEGVNRVKYHEEGRVLCINADRLTIFNGTVVSKAEVWLNPDKTIDYLRAEESFYYELNGQTLELKSLGLYADGSPWSLSSLDDMNLTYKDQSFETDGFTKVDFYPDGSLKQVFGTFRLSLQFNLNTLESSLIRRVDFNPDSSLSFLQFYGYENIKAPVLGEVKTNTIHFDTHGMPEIISFSEDSNGPRQIQLSDSTRFFIKDGLVGLHNSTITGITRAYSPYEFDLPGNRILRMDGQGKRISVDYYDNGSLRKVFLQDEYFDLELGNGQVIKTDNVEFHENGVIKEVFFRYSTELSFPVLGTISCARIEFSPEGDLVKVNLGKAGTLNYEAFGQNAELYSVVVFYEGGNLAKASLSNEISFELVSGDVVSCDGNFKLYPDGSIEQIGGVSKEMELHLPDGNTASIYKDSRKTISFHNNGQIKGVFRLDNPYTVTFPNGATATAHTMVEYDKQGNILSFY